MSLKQNIIYIYFKGKHQVTSKSQYQYNRGQYLYFADLNLPQAFEVHFSSKDKGESKTQIGSDNLVEIPDEYFWNGALQIYAWIYLHSKTTDGETIYEVRIPLTKRAKPTDEEPLPVQQSTIDRAIAELNNAVDITTENANKTEEDKTQVGNIRDEVVDLKENIDATAETVAQKSQEAIDASRRSEASAQNAAEFEDGARRYSEDAGQSAQEALESKNTAKQKAQVANDASAEAKDFRDEAETFKNEAEQAKQNIVDYRDETKGYRDETLTAKDDTQTIKGDVQSLKTQIDETATDVATNASDAKSSADLSYRSAISADKASLSASQFADEASDFADSAGQSANQAEEFKNQSATNVTHYPKVADGYWYVWDASKNEYVNTNVDARGIKGDKGDIGKTGNGIENTVLNSDYTLTITFTDGTSYTTPSIRGEKGIKGDVGNGIASTVLNDDYTLTLTFTNGTTYTTPSIRGEKGEKGEPATDMDIHICSASEYDAETRIPTIANPNDKTFYLVPTEDGTSPDLFTEWVYVNGAWEMFGSAKIDLSGYLTDVQINGTSIVENGVANVPVDTSLTIAGAAADAKKTGDEISELSDNTQIVSKTAFDVYHGDLNSPKSIKFVGNALAFSNARYAIGKNYFPNMSRTWTYKEVELSASKQFVTLNGTASGTSSTQAFNGALETVIPAGDYKLRIEFSEQVNTSSRFIITGTYDNSESVTIISKYINETTELSFTAQHIITKIVVQVGVGSGNVYSNARLWFGIYNADAIIVDTGLSVPASGEITYDSNTLHDIDELDTMQHVSEVDYVEQTKKYIDGYIPDIIGFWTQNVYVLPEQFGAVGDGITDDYEALAECIAYAITSGKAVRGYGEYKTSGTIVFDGEGLDVYIKQIEYTGDQSAIDIRNEYISFGFHEIISAGVGITFSGTTKYARRCKVAGISVSSTGDCIVAKEYTLYNTCDIKYLSSANGNCITFALVETSGAFHANEYVFRDSSCHCPQGWVAMRPSDSKFYNFTVEGDCLNGICYPSSSVFYGWRHAEFVLRYSYRISDPDSQYQHGALIKLKGADSCIYESSNELFPWSIDIDEKISDYINNTDTWWAFSTNVSYIKCRVVAPYSVFHYKSKPVVAKEITVFGSNKVFIPLFGLSIDIDTNAYDLRFYDTCDIESIRSAEKILLATEFNIRADTTIYLCSAYCAVGFNRFILHTNDHVVTVFDKDGNKVFDSQDYQANEFEVSCLADRSNRGLGPADPNNRYWTYDGTNHKWEIKVL